MTCGVLGKGSVANVNTLQNTPSDLVNQSLRGVTLLRRLQTLAFGFRFYQSLHGVPLPSSQQALTFGWCHADVSPLAALLEAAVGDISGSPL